ncbi:hypothetical protein KAR91_10610 [Candidatus Pacearchaeota archaeon]|nr:hypothetical protein [Candidatus Pacearchaeota archaeon]
MIKSTVRTLLKSQIVAQVSSTVNKMLHWILRIGVWEDDGVWLDEANWND